MRFKLNERNEGLFYNFLAAIVLIIIWAVL